MNELAAVEAHHLLGDVGVLRLAAVSLVTCSDRLRRDEREELRRMLIERRATARLHLRHLPAETVERLRTTYGVLFALAEQLIAAGPDLTDNDRARLSPFVDAVRRAGDEPLRLVALGVPA